MRIIFPVLWTVREWQLLMIFRFKCYDPDYYVWSKTMCPRYRRWKRKRSFLDFVASGFFSL